MSKKLSKNCIELLLIMVNYWMLLIYNYTMIVNMNSNSIHNKRPKTIWSDWILNFWICKDSFLDICCYVECPAIWTMSMKMRQFFFWKCHHLKIIKNWQSPAHTHHKPDRHRVQQRQHGCYWKMFKFVFFLLWLSLNLYFFKRKWLVGWWWYSFVLFDWLVDVVEFIQFQIM